MKLNMLRRAVFWLILVTAVAAGQDFLPVKQFFDKELTMTTIDSNVYVVEHAFPWAANTLIIRLDGGRYVWANTTYTDQAAEQIVNWLREHDKNKISLTVINTHFHMDNLGGNGYLEKSGAEVYGSDMTVKLLAEEQARTGQLEMLKDPSLKKYFDYYRDVKFTPPNHVFKLEEGLSLIFGKDTIDVWYPGPGHTRDNVVVYYAARKILFGGCIIKSLASKSKGYTGDADIAAWPESLMKLKNRYPDARVVIPGHGQWGGVELINHTIDIIK